MLMKIVTGVLAVLLIATLGAAAMFYLNTYKPMDADYARMKAGLPEMDKAKAELKKLKEKENSQLAKTAWMAPVIDALSAGLSDEIKSGSVEVLAAGDKVVVNIAEQALFVTGAYTFAQQSPQLRSSLAALLKEKIQDKDIYIGNSTEGVPAQIKRRKKIPGKDARTLAAERSAVLIKDFEKNGVNPDKLIAAAYSAKGPEAGLRIKGHKTIIIIENKPMAPAGEIKQTSASASVSHASATITTAATSSPSQPKPIPIQPAQPKAQ